MTTINVQPLPLRRSTFSTLRERNEIFVDKMNFIYELTRSVAPDQWVELKYPNKEVSVSMAQFYAYELLNGQRLQ